MAEDLKTHGLTEHPDPLSSSTTMVIDQNVEELFVPYLQDRGYIERERESLEQLYSGLLLKFTMFHVGRSFPNTKCYFLKFNVHIGSEEKGSKSRCVGSIQEDPRKGD